MFDLFLYNWQIREDWFRWCESLPDEELHKRRVGGMGSIINNLFHVVDCEQLWINQMRNKPIIKMKMGDCLNISDVREYSNLTRLITEEFLETLTNIEEKTLEITSKSGTTYSFPFEKVILHIITHEIHHMGQLSVWSREIGIKPISSDLILRDFA